MQIICDQCGRKIDSTNNFCSFCGMEAPRRTLLFSEEEIKIEIPVYCAHCKVENVNEALYCSDCGESIYSKPSESYMFCGKCGTKNKEGAKICIECGLNFSDWFNMKGEVADKLGFQGDLILKEKMTGFTYHFISSNKFLIGRNSTNDMIIPCSWVSSKHCEFNLKEKRLIDSSTNGTFINRKPDHIKSEPLEYISEFNIAGSFTFPLVKKENLYIFHLGAIIDEKECRRNGDGASFDKLRKTYFILYQGDFKLKIQKMDGYIGDKLKPHSKYYRFRLINGFYYYSDKDRDIDNNLIVKEFSNLPRNWKVSK
jgi:hypothetical protein